VGLSNPNYQELFSYKISSHRNSVASIIKAAYGYQVSANDDYIVRIIEEAFEDFTAIQAPGRFLIEFFPFCAFNLLIIFNLSYWCCLRLRVVRFIPSWFPLAGFKRYAKVAKKKMDRVQEVPFQWTKKNIVSPTLLRAALIFTFKISCQSSGNFTESFVSRHLLEENGPVTDPDAQDYLMWASSALYVGGGDTVSVTFIHPDLDKLYFVFRPSQSSRPFSSPWPSILKCSKEHRNTLSNLRQIGCRPSTITIPYRTSGPYSRN
jgi:hypothetical protein